MIVRRESNVQGYYSTYSRVLIDILILQGLYRLFFHRMIADRFCDFVQPYHFEQASRDRSDSGRCRLRHRSDQIHEVLD